MRLGVGADVNVGPAKLGASAMTWWDASTNAWVKSDVSLDYGVDRPGGGVSGAFTCEAWKSGQELLDADMASFFGSFHHIAEQARLTPSPSRVYIHPNG